MKSKADVVIYCFASCCEDERSTECVFSRLFKGSKITKNSMFVNLVDMRDSKIYPEKRTKGMTGPKGPSEFKDRLRNNTVRADVLSAQREEQKIGKKSSSAL